MTSASPSPDRRDGATLAWDAGTSLDGFEVTVDGSDGGTETGTQATTGDGPGFGVAAALAALAALAGLAVRRR